MNDQIRYVSTGQAMRRMERYHMDSLTDKYLHIDRHQCQFGIASWKFVLMNKYTLIGKIL